LIRAAAISRWQSAGLSEAQTDWLNRASFSIADLHGDVLGLAFADRIVIDVNAAGYGWFIDDTPLLDEEFEGSTSLAGAPASHMDLLTVVSHELGHLLGLDDLDTGEHGHDVMADHLSAGVRRLPSPDALDLLMEQF
jgi:hypothetical protein